MVGWIKMKLGMQVGFGPGNIVLDGDPAPPTERGTAARHFRNLRAQALPASIQSAAHVYCNRTAGWIKMPFGTEVGLGLGHIALDADPPSPQKRENSSSQFSAHVYCGQTAGWIKMKLGL